MDIIALLDQFRAFVLLVLGFGFVIFVHELGHFLAAKGVGIKVSQFAIGFGPSIFSYRKGIGFRLGSTEAEFEKRVNEHTSKRGENPAGASAVDEKIKNKYADEAVQSLGLSETEYRLNWFPLGGYVKMLGQEDMDPSAVSDDERAFNRKPVWARAIVVSAGVVMNLIFGVIFFIIAFMMGVGFNPAVVGDVAFDSPAQKAYAQGHDNDPRYHGLRLGDTILEVNGKHVNDFSEMRVNVAVADEPVTLVVEREREGGAPERLTYVMKSERDAEMQLFSLGIGNVPDIKIDLADADLPEDLKKGGVTKEMHVQSVDGRPVGDFPHFNRLIAAKKGEPALVVFEGEKDKKKITGRANLGATPALMHKKIAEAKDDTPAVYETHLIGLLPATQFGDVVHDHPAAAAGFQHGDVVARVGPVQWPTLAQFRDAVAASKNRKLAVKVLRDNKPVDLTVTPARDGKIGVELKYALNTNRIAGVLPGTATATLELNPGAEILSINGAEVHNFGDMQRLLSAAAADTSGDNSATPPATHPATLKVAIGYRVAAANQDPVVTEVELPPAAVSELALTEWHQPLARDVFAPALVQVQTSNPLQAAGIGIDKTGNFMVQTWLTVRALILGRVPLNQMSGPVGIAHRGTQITQHGLSYLFWFLGLISANLAVINFLPIPVVDGGLMVMLIIEKLKGSPVSPKIQVAMTYVGLALILSLFLYITYWDVHRLVMS